MLNSSGSFALANIRCAQPAPSPLGEDVGIHPAAQPLDGVCSAEELPPEDAAGPAEVRVRAARVRVVITDQVCYQCRSRSFSSRAPAQRRGLCRARAQKLRKGRCVTLNALALRLLCAVELHVPNNAL